MSNTPIHCLVVEDNLHLNRDLVFYLGTLGMQAHGVVNGEEMDRHLAAQPCDVVVLDLGLPGEDGLSIARRLGEQSDLGIVILTARGQLEDRLAGWASGAHVYLVKPAPLEEIAAVVNAVYRLSRPSEEASGPPLWTLHPLRRELTAPDGSQIPLTHRERLMLTAMAEAPEQRIPRDLVLGQDSGGAIDTLIHRLRRKLKVYGDPIRTLYGEGFIFTETLTVHSPEEG